MILKLIALLAYIAFFSYAVITGLDGSFCSIFEKNK